MRQFELGSMSLIVFLAMSVSGFVTAQSPLPDGSYFCQKCGVYHSNATGLVGTSIPPAAQVSAAQVPAAQVPAAQFRSGVGSGVRNVLAALNAQRSRQGIGALRYDGSLQAVAERRAQKMASMGMKSHPPGSFARNLRRRGLVQFLFAIGSLGMLHQRYEDAIRRGRDGDRSRWRLLCRRVSLAFKHSGRVNLGLWSVDQIRPFAMLLACWLIADTTSASGQTHLVAPGSVSLDSGTAKASVQWLVDKALAELPRSIDGDKDWGNTKRVWAGISMKRDGFKLKTHRKFKDVDHGRWVRYEVTLPPPGSASGIDVSIDSVTRVSDPVTGQERWRIESTVDAPMHFSARVQRHNLGVRLISVTVTGKMKVRLASSVTIGIYPDYRKIPPDLVVEPVIQRANLRLTSFEVDRVSHIGGDAAEAWGEIVQEVLVERFVNKQDEKLVAKLNRSIEKKRTDLRISPSQWFTLAAQQSDMK